MCKRGKKFPEMLDLSRNDTLPNTLQQINEVLTITTQSSGVDSKSSDSRLVHAKKLDAVGRFPVVGRE